MKKIFSITVITQFIISLPVIASTNADMAISTNTVWNKAGSPYIITENVLVDTSATLTIEPGVEVKLNSGKCILVKGVLNAIGTPSDSIIISAQNTTQRWQRLWFQSTSRCSLKYCRIEYAGSSAIYNEGSNSLYIGYNTISNNSASYGGGIYNYSGRATITNNTISNNSASYGYGAGSGVCNYGKATITNNIISNNSTTCYGGGIFNYDSAIINNNTISNNLANYYGGGIFNSGTATITNNTISNNSASSGYGGGGGVCNFGTATIINNTLSNNSAYYGGGSVYNYGKKATIKYNAIIDITTSAIYNNGGILFVRTNNISSTGYAVYNNDTLNIDAKYNYWNTTSSSIIDTKIYDYYDSNFYGIAFYRPFLSAPFSDTIAPPAPINLTANKLGSDSTFEINWINPTDPSGISEYYYKIGSAKVGSAPTSDFDTTSAFHYPPDTITLAANESLFVWLVDSSGNVNYKNRASLRLVEIEETTHNSKFTTQISITPNPSMEDVVIKYGLPEKLNVALSLYNISGRLVKTFYSGSQEKGYHTVNIREDEVAKGVYFLKFQADNYTETKKLVLMK